MGKALSPPPPLLSGGFALPPELKVCAFECFIMFDPETDSFVMRIPEGPC